MTARSGSGPWWWALGTAVLVAGACLSDFFVLRPLQQAGRLDGAAVALHVVVTWLSLPGMAVGRLIYVINHHISPGKLTHYYLLVTAATALCYGALVWVAARHRGRRRDRAGDQGHRPTAAQGGGEARVSRRRVLLRGAGLGAAGGVVVLAGYATAVEPRRPVVRRLRLALPGWPAGLGPLRVVHLTDLHLGRFVSEAYLRAVVDRVNVLGPDLVLLTGDYVHGSGRFVDPVASVIGGLRARFGRVGVLGNHDFWEGARRSRAALRSLGGVRLVDNDRVWLTREGLSDHPPRGGGALVLAGLGDLWEDRTAMDQALGGVAPDLPRLLLAHNPDSAEVDPVVRSGHRVDLMLAGHTHGGQVRLPGTRALITPSRHGAKYARGMVNGPAFPVHVSAGIGTTILPVRLLVPPEIVVLELA